MTFAIMHRRMADESLNRYAFVLYDRLRALARSRMLGQRAGHTLDPTGLANEAIIRLLKCDAAKVNDEEHFMMLAAEAMRQILVDRTRRLRASKRGSAGGVLPLDEAIGLPHQRSVDLILLDDALERLAKLDERQCRIVELRFFAGLSLDETSVALGISEATVSREWTTARVWLRHEITGLA